MYDKWQEQNVDLCQQAFWFINELCKVDSNVRVLHGVGGLSGVKAALKRNPRSKNKVCVLLLLLLRGLCSLSFSR